MDIIRNRKVVPDLWRLELDAVEDRRTSEIAPGDVIVSLDRWVVDWEALLARGARVGVRLQPGDDLDRLLATELHELWLVEFHFASFADGRAYSQARLLRSRHDYHGGIRASGDVSRDRLAFMERCGFDEFVLATDPAEALAAFDEFTGRYQPDGPDDRTIAYLRGQRERSSVRTAA